MNSDNFRSFILEHGDEDPARLLLSRDKWKDIDIGLAAATIQARRKLKSKVPAWHAEPGLVFPLRLSTEQCSSQRTAMYKAEVARQLLEETESASSGAGIADLTGGMGVDCWAFSKAAGHVLYNEAEPALAEAARHNFGLLGMSNVTVRCGMLEPGHAADILGDFRPGLIFLDPARRDGEGKRVFLMEDCRPDVLALEDELLSISRFLMVKLSPMADIDMVTGRLGKRCRALHVVTSDGECKELLAVLDREYDGETLIEVCGDDGSTFPFTRQEEKSAQATFPADEEEVRRAEYLFEPGKGLMKSGAFRLTSSRFGVMKLSPGTHLYLFSGKEKAEKLRGLGKIFRILEIFPMTGRGIREVARKYPMAEVTAKNTRMSSDALRKKLGTGPSDRLHIFGAEYLFVTEREQWSWADSNRRPNTAPGGFLHA